MRPPPRRRSARCRAAARTASSAPAYVGGVALAAPAGCSQTHVVLGFPIPSLRDDRPRRRGRRGAVRRRHELAADGRDPRAPRPRLLRRVLGRRACELCGPVRHRGVDRAGAARRVLRRSAPAARRAGRGDRRRSTSSARATRSRCARLRAQERPSRRLEDAALDLFVHGRVRSRAELTARTEASPRPRCATPSRRCSRRAPRSPSPASCARARSSARASCSRPRPEPARAARHAQAAAHRPARRPRPLRHRGPGLVRDADVRGDGGAHREEPRLDGRQQRRLGRHDRACDAAARRPLARAGRPVRRAQRALRRTSRRPGRHGSACRATAARPSRSPACTSRAPSSTRT